MHDTQILKSCPVYKPKGNSFKISKELRDTEIHTLGSFSLLECAHGVETWVARGLFYSVRLATKDRVKGPYGVFEDLQVQVKQKMLKLKLSKEPPLGEEWKDKDLDIEPYLLFGPAEIRPPPRTSSCLYHDARQAECDEQCVLRPFFNRESSTSFKYLYSRLRGTSENIVNHMANVDQKDRPVVAHCLIWEAREWYLHPAGGPLRSIRNLRRVLFLLEELELGELELEERASSQKVEVVESADVHMKKALDHWKIAEVHEKISEAHVDMFAALAQMSAAFEQMQTTNARVYSVANDEVDLVGANLGLAQGHERMADAHKKLFHAHIEMVGALDEMENTELFHAHIDMARALDEMENTEDL